MQNPIEFFDKPFTFETIIKLEFYEMYVESAIPVFINLSYIRVINIFDFFAGAGRDVLGTPGSPIRAIEKLKKYEDLLRKKHTKVCLYLNDYDPEVYERLIANVEEMEFDRNLIQVIPSQKDFSVRLKEVKLTMKRSSHANIAFFDQFGIDKITPELFRELVSIKFTDILFFVSSSILTRFGQSNRMAFIENLSITPEDLKTTKFYQIHQFVWERYKNLIPPEGREYHLVPFSIKYKSEIYGLIFGSGSLTGVQKFLQICWHKDKLRGTANFDIDNDNITAGQVNLFTGGVSKPKKAEIFEEKLKSKILSREIQSDKELVYFCLENGFLGRHAKPVIKALENSKIACNGLSFSLSSVSKSTRKPIPIILL